MKIELTGTDNHNIITKLEIDADLSDHDNGVALMNDCIRLFLCGKKLYVKVCVVRIIETHGRASSGSIDFNGKIIECDLMEWEDYGEYEKVDSSYVVSLNPFEIKTFKIQFEGNNYT